MIILINRCPVIVSRLPPVSYWLRGQELPGLVQADLIIVATFILVLLFKSVIGRLQMELLLSLFRLGKLLWLLCGRLNVDVVSTFVTGHTFYFRERALQVWQVLRNLVRCISRFSRLVVFLGKRLSVRHRMTMRGYQLNVSASLIILLLLIVALSVRSQVDLDVWRRNHGLLLLLLALESFAVGRFFFRDVARWFENVSLIRGVHKRRWSYLADIILSRLSAILVIVFRLLAVARYLKLVISFVDQFDFLILFGRIKWLELNHIGVGWLMSNRHLLLNLNALSLC